ncbi:hypothetical protein [Staphylococcus phage vB_SauH_DELF3]|nr:hypothetical protein [Staphylococcus phage vB_SauH_DELF3]
MTEDGAVDLIRLFSALKSSRPDMVEADLERIIDEKGKCDTNIMVAVNGDSANKILKLINFFGRDKEFGCTCDSRARSSGQCYAHYNENNKTITVDDLMQNKCYIQDWQAKRISVYETVGHELKTYPDHWQIVVIMDEAYEKTGPNYQVWKSRGVNHYSQSAVIKYITLTRLKETHDQADGKDVTSTLPFTGSQNTQNPSSNESPFDA